MALQRMQTEVENYESIHETGSKETTTEEVLKLKANCHSFAGGIGGAGGMGSGL
jgi:hypothetical protein